VKLAIKTVAVTAGALAALTVSGCGVGATGGAAARERPQASVSACIAYGVHAIEDHVTVTRTPAPCQGLSRAEVNQAVGTAVLRVTGEGPKVHRRKRAAEAAKYLYHLVTALPPAAASSAVPASSGSRSQPRSRDFSLNVAALVAWLVTAASGGYVLALWFAHGGTLRRRPGTVGTGAPAWVIFGHFGLALAGLAAWAAYLITGWTALAWACVLVLLPVAGLGMAALAIGLPRRRSANVAGSGRDGDGAPSRGRAAAIGAGPAGMAGPAEPAAAGIAGAVGPGGTAGPIGTLRLAGVTGQAEAVEQAAALGQRASAAPGRAQSFRTRLTPLVIAAHGALATTTMLLVVLAALGAIAS
jgi:hypothetical protein